MKTFEKFRATSVSKKGMSKMTGGYDYTWEYEGTGNMGADGKEIMERKDQPD